MESAGAGASRRRTASGRWRKLAEEKDPGLKAALERLLDPATRGDPEGPLRWTTQSAAHLSAALAEQGARRASGR